jgi:stearoyl-CoA desaturase (delta-9 desaturase)
VSKKTKTPSTKAKIRINWVGAGFLTLSPIAAVVFTALHLYLDGFIWQIWAFAAVMYTLTASSITGGYHRYFAHRAYECRNWLKCYWAIFGGAAFQSSILEWARDHRVHHRFVDSDKDPYSINKGFWYAHFGWMMTINEDTQTLVEPYGRDLEKDPIVKFQDDHYVSIAITFGLLMPTVVGYFLGSAFGGLAVAGFVRIVALHHGTFFINSWCHFFGRQPYTDENTAKDSFIMAVATFGEGYHNFHHIFAQDYRNGIRWYHWDPTKWMIVFFKWIGGAHSLRSTPWTEIIKAQMRMDEKRLKDRLQSHWQVQFQQQVDSLKLRVEAAHQRFEQLKTDYKQSADIYRQSGWDKLDEMKRQMRAARREFRFALKQWREYKTFLMAIPAPA